MFATAEVEATAARRELTEKQQRVYEYICSRVEQWGYPPTVREIGEHFGIASPNGVVCHLKALEAKGWIKRAPDAARAIRVDGVHVGVPKRVARGIPVMGRISAGGLLEAIELGDEWSLDDLFTEVSYAAVVEGQGFERQHVIDGDRLLFARGRCVGMLRLIEN